MNVDHAFAYTLWTRIVIVTARDEASIREGLSFGSGLGECVVLMERFSLQREKTELPCRVCRER